MTRVSLVGETRSMDAPGTGSELDNEVKSAAKVVRSGKSSWGKVSNRPEDKLNERRMDRRFRENVEKSFKFMVEIPKNWDEWTVREQRDWTYLQYRNYCKDLPQSLTFLCVGNNVSDECQRSEFDERPEWLDHDKFLRGQRFAMDNMAGMFYAQLLSLFMLFSSENGLKPLILTNKSSAPFTAYQRYLSTGVKVRNWYTSDIWSKDTAGYKDVQTVRKMHAAVRQKLTNLSTEDLDRASKIHEPWCPTRATFFQDVLNSCPVPSATQCPFIISEDEQFRRCTGMNQGEMSATQSGFVTLVILYPEKFGIHGATDEDLDAFCHVWRSIGYLLGVEDEFNFCSGSLEDVKQRSRDALQYWFKPNLRNITPEWEHMLRCVVEGIQYYLPAATSYEHSLLYFAELLDMEVPKLRSSMSYFSWIQYLLFRAIFTTITKLKGVPELMNFRLNRAIDRALNFTDKQLKVLRERSNETLSKGIAETKETRSPNDLATSTHWHRLPFLAFFISTSFLFKFSTVLKELVHKLFRIDESIDYCD